MLILIGCENKLPTVKLLIPMKDKVEKSRNKSKSIEMRQKRKEKG